MNEFLKDLNYFKTEIDNLILIEKKYTFSIVILEGIYQSLYEKFRHQSFCS